VPGNASPSRRQGRAGRTRWSPKRKQVRWAPGTSWVLYPMPVWTKTETARSYPHGQPHGLHPTDALRQVTPTTATPSPDAVLILQRLTSFMELNDPELLAAVVATVGTESLEALIRSASPSTAHCSHAQPELDKLGQPQPPLPSWVEENGEATLLLQQEAELAELHQEAETTRQLIAEVHRRAEEATAASGAATTATLDQALSG